MKISENKTALFFINENKKKITTQKLWKIHAKLVERNVMHLCFVPRTLRLSKRRTRKERLWHVFIILEKMLKQFKL